MITSTLLHLTNTYAAIPSNVCPLLPEIPESDVRFLF
jgi:hypothetical protein